MMTATQELIDSYLARLDSAARTLAPDRRSELLQEIKEHIAVTLAEAGTPDETAVRNVLDRLGDPEEIAREAGATSVPPHPPLQQGPGRLQIAVVLLLLLGGIVVPFLGWVVGAALLWASTRWTLRDKLIGTLVWPGGLGIAVFVLLFSSSSSTCGPDGRCETSGMSASLGLILVVAGLIGPLVTACHLLLRASRPSPR